MEKENVGEKQSTDISEEEIDTTSSITDENNTSSISDEDNAPSADITECHEIEEPCVALTIIGENKLTDAEVFVRRGIKFSVKAFFSTLVLTIMHMFM